MCLYPKIIKNRKYIANKKNKGIIPEIKDKRTLYIPAGCGKCIECMKQKARQWQVRLTEDIKTNTNAKFITFTYAPDKLELLKNEINLTGYNLDNEIAKLSVKRFRERWRKETGKSIRHWLITEIGGNYTEGLHIHGIIWTNENKEYIEKKWQYGTIFIGTYVNEATTGYITKYITKTDAKHKEYTPIILTSSGIGKNYIGTLNNKNNKYKETETKEYYQTRTGIKLNLPIYYKNNTYTEEEKEKLWLEKLDKQERYILGKKIDISKNEDKYYKILELAREKNKRLGYGDNQKNWDQKRYENERRNLKIIEKIKKNTSDPPRREGNTPSHLALRSKKINNKKKLTQLTIQLNENSNIFVNTINEKGIIIINK